MGYLVQPPLGHIAIRTWPAGTPWVMTWMKSGTGLLSQNRVRGSSPVKVRQAFRA
jgi:hypothetical protein